MEEWRDIPGWEGMYQASDHGRIRSLDRNVTGSRGNDISLRGKVLRQNADKAGYLRVTFSRNGKETRMYAHRVILSAFKGEASDDMAVRHLDGNPKNNSLDNLAWGTYSENNYDIVRHGRHNHASQAQCKRGHRKSERNAYQAALDRGWMPCKACTRARTYKRNHPELQLTLEELADLYYEDLMKESN